MTDITGGQSERTALGDRAGGNASLRRLTGKRTIACLGADCLEPAPVRTAIMKKCGHAGCNVYGSEDGQSSFTARKNENSGPEAEHKYVKGKKACEQRQPAGPSNPISAPASCDIAEGKRYKGHSMRMDHGNIIIRPPSEADTKRSRGPAAPSAQKSRLSHGDIISGRDQQISTASGKRRTDYGKSITEHGTLGMLHWSENSSARKAPPATRFERNSSSQMQAAFGGSSRPKAAPKGYSTIERLAIGTAFAVSAPRDNAAGRYTSFVCDSLRHCTSCLYCPSPCSWILPTSGIADLTR